MTNELLFALLLSLSPPPISSFLQTAPIAHSSSTIPSFSSLLLSPDSAAAFSQFFALEGSDLSRDAPASMDWLQQQLQSGRTVVFHQKYHPDGYLGKVPVQDWLQASILGRTGTAGAAPVAAAGAEAEGADAGSTSDTGPTAAHSCSYDFWSRTAAEEASAAAAARAASQTLLQREWTQRNGTWSRAALTSLRQLAFPLVPVEYAWGFEPYALMRPPLLAYDEFFRGRGFDRSTWYLQRMAEGIGQRMAEGIGEGAQAGAGAGKQAEKKGRAGKSKERAQQQQQQEGEGGSAKEGEEQEQKQEQTLQQRLMVLLPDMFLFCRNDFDAYRKGKVADKRTRPVSAGRGSLCCRAGEGRRLMSARPQTL